MCTTNSTQSACCAVGLQAAHSRRTEHPANQTSHDASFTPARSSMTHQKNMLHVSHAHCRPPHALAKVTGSMRSQKLHRVPVLWATHEDRSCLPCVPTPLTTNYKAKDKSPNPLHTAAKVTRAKHACLLPVVLDTLPTWRWHRYCSAAAGQGNRPSSQHRNLQEIRPHPTRAWQPCQRLSPAQSRPHYPHCLHDDYLL